MTDIARLQGKMRNLSRDITRDVMGTIIASCLAVFMPWLAGSAVFNFASLVKNMWQIRRLKQLFRDIGLRIKKRHILSGLLQGAVVKLGTTIISFGHDDFVAMVNQTASHIKSITAALNWNWSPPAYLKQGFDRMKVAESKRDGNKFVHTIEAVAGKPTEWTQRALGVDSASDLKRPGEGSNHGWNASRGVVVKQLLLTGTVQVGSDKLADRCLDRNIDHVWDKGRQLCH